MDNKEDPKVHCIVLSKLPHDLVNGRTEWKLCKVFSTLSNSFQRIHREKNATRKYKPVLAFSVSNPSDTDRHALNRDKGSVKDCLGFSVNSETVAALVDGAGAKETQWVLTASEHLNHFSVQENLTMDTFYDNKFDESKLEGSLPSLFKLQSVCNRREVFLASPFNKPPTGEDRLKRPKPASKGHERKGEKTIEKNTTTPKVVSEVVPSKSKGDLNGNYHAAQSKYNDDIPQKAEITVKKSSPNNKQERESNVSLKCGHPTKERQRFTTSKIISKETVLPPESPEYDCEPSDSVNENPQATTPKVIERVKEKVSEYDQKSKPDPFDKDQACAMPRVVIEVKEDASEHDKVPKQNHQSKSHSSAGGDRKSKQNAISERREIVSEATHKTGRRKLSGENGIANNFSPKGKGVCEGGRNERTFNKNHPVKASAQKTAEHLRADIFVKYHKTKKNGDPKKKDEYRGCLDKENLQSGQSFNPVASLVVKTSHSHSKAKRRTSSDQDTASPTKRHRLSNGGDTTMHKQPSVKYPSNEKRSDSEYKSVAKNPTKSRTGAGVNDSTENKGPSKLPSYPCLPTTTVPRKKSVSDSVTALKVVLSPYLGISKLKNLREEPIGKHAETGAEVENCLDDKRDRASQSTPNVTSRAGTSNSSVKRHTPDSGKDECGDTKRRKHTSGSTNSLSKLFQGKFQREACRSPSVDSGSIKKTKERPKIFHEDKIAEVKSSSKAMQAKGNHTAKKGVLENEGKPQSKTFRSHSVESGRTKTVKEIDKKISHEEKIPLMKFSSNSEQAKGDDTANKGIFKNACRLDFRQTREDNPSVTKKDDNKSEPHDQTTTSQADPESTGFDLLGSLNTKDSFLFNSENRKELCGAYNFMEAFVQSGHYDLTDSSKVQTLNSTTIQSMSNDASLSHMKRGAVFSNQEPQYEDTKRPKTEERQAGKLPEIKQDVPRKGESHGEKRAERQSSPLHCENPCRLSHHRNTPVGKQEKQLQNAQEKHSSKKRSEVTLLVGDTMLQHIQPDKFFEKKHVVVKTVPGARADNISKKIIDFVRQENPSSVILHVGTYDLEKGIMHIAAHIESVGKLITQTFPSVKNFAISSIIQRREDITDAKCAKVSDVNKSLKNIHLEHGWDYIDNGNLDPEVHLGKNGIHLNPIGIEAFAANISKHIGLVECGVQQPVNNAGHVTNHQLPVHVTSKDNENSCTPCSENSGNVFISSEKNAADEKPVTLLAGDSMLESFKQQEDFSNKQVTRYVVPYARVDTFGDTVIDFVKYHRFDEVIIHIGSNDLNDNVFTPKEIASKIEQIGVDLEKTCPSISKITMCGTISENRQGARDVNALLKKLQSKHSWGYICNDNVSPIFHNGPFDVKLRDPSAEVFAENVMRFLRPPNLTGTRSTDVQVPGKRKGHSRPRQENSSKVGTSCEEHAAVTAKMGKCMGSDILPRRNTNQPLVPKDQPVANGEATIKDTDHTAALHTTIRAVANSITGKKNVEKEKLTLLIGDSMLKSIIPQKLSRTKRAKLVVVHDACVDNIGEEISKHAKNPNVDEVILHIGSSDLRNDVYNQKEIATKIEAIGMTLETTCPHIAAFTVSGVINTYRYKRAESRSLNALLRSFTSEHGWAYICNDNLYPTLHIKPCGTNLTSRGTRLFASNIIRHLRSVKPQRFRTASQAPGVKGNVDQSSFTNSGSEHCQDLVVHGREEKAPPKDPKADVDLKKHPKANIDPQNYPPADRGTPKDPKADRGPPKCPSCKESNDDGLGSNAGTDSRPLDNKTGYSDRHLGQSQTFCETHLNPSRRMKHKLHKRNRKTDNSWERPNSKSWLRGADGNGYHSGHNEYSSARYLHSTTHGPTHVQNIQNQNTLRHHAHGYSRCFCCGELGHKRANCPRR